MTHILNIDSLQEFNIHIFLILVSHYFFCLALYAT